MIHHSERLYNKKAFTLAEVLITLGIIGIVAAMTMPVLIAKYRSKVLETQFKKRYSEVSQVFIQLKKMMNTCRLLVVHNCRIFL